MEEQDQNASGAPQAAPSREELEQHVRARAWKDEAFRQELLANPRAVFERDYAAWFSSGKIHSHLAFKIIEEDEQTLCFVLPPKVPDALLGLEDLNEEDLLSEVAAAGARTITNPICPTERCTRDGCSSWSWCSNNCR